MTVPSSATTSPAAGARVAVTGSTLALAFVLLRVVIAISVVALAGPARREAWATNPPAPAQSPSSPSILDTSDVRWLERRGWLERDDARALRILGSYGPRVAGAEGVRLKDVRIARLEGLECALGRVTVRRLGVAQFFADALFRGGVSSPIVLIDGATSAALERVFDLHTIFPSAVRSGGHEVHMLFMLAGQGKLMMAYDGAATYVHPDPAYAILGSRSYNIYPFVRMTIGTHGAVPALLDIGVASGPAAPLRPFEKPVLFLSPAIHALYVHERDVTADTSVINRTIRPPPIAWRPTADVAFQRLQQLGCPADRAWVESEK